MAQDLTTPRADPALMISSPALLKLRRISVGTVQWPGQPMRTYLAGGLSLTPSLRAETERALAALKAATTADDSEENQRGRLAIVAKMLLTYPTAGASNETGKARAEAYLEALDDVSPWAISAAVKAWNRGSAGDQHDYRWAPAPATLRKISLEQGAPYKPVIMHLENLLAAVPMEEAMKTPTPEDRAYVTEGFERLKVDIGTGRRPSEPSQHQPAGAAE